MNQQALYRGRLSANVRPGKPIETKMSQWLIADVPATVHHGMLPVEKDGVHFNHEGQVRLGRMTADALEELYTSKRK